MIQSYQLLNKQLIKAIDALNPVFKAKRKHPILAGVLVILRDNKITLAGTDLQTSKVQTVDHFDGSDCEAIINFEFFKKLVKAIAKTGAEFWFEASERGLVLKGKTFSYDLASIAEVSEFPFYPMPAKAEPIAAVAEVAEVPAIIEPEPVIEPVKLPEPEIIPEPVLEPVAVAENVVTMEASKPRKAKQSKTMPKTAKQAKQKQSKPLAVNPQSIVLTGDYATDLEVAQKLGIVPNGSDPGKGILYATIALYQGKRRLLPVRARFTQDLKTARDAGLFGLIEKPEEDALYQALYDFNMAMDQLCMAA